MTPRLAILVCLLCLGATLPVPPKAKPVPKVSTAVQSPKGVETFPMAGKLVVPPKLFTLRLAWDRPDTNLWGGWLKSGAMGGTLTNRMKVLERATTNSCVVSNLTTGRFYSFAVTRTNVAGESLPSNVVNWPQTNFFQWFTNVYFTATKISGPWLTNSGPKTFALTNFTTGNKFMRGTPAKPPSMSRRYRF